MSAAALSGVLHFALDRASAAQIEAHLRRCDAAFVPRLSSRVDLGGYAAKLAAQARRFEAWHGAQLIGLVAAYANDRQTHAAHISNVSVLPGWTGQGLAMTLLQQCIEHARASGMRTVGLEVAAGNDAALRLYTKAGFRAADPQAPLLAMCLPLLQGEGRDPAT